MKALSAFLPFIIPKVPGCSEPLAEQALIASAIEFCSKARVHVHTTDAFTVAAGEYEVDIDDIPNGTYVADVLSLSVDGAKIDPKTPDELDQTDAEWATNTGTVSSYHRTRGKTLRLVSIPDEDVELIVKVSLQPTRAATSLDDELFERYVEALAAGAIYRLKDTPGQPFTDTAGVAYYRAMFDAAIHSASLSAAKSGTRAPLRAAICY